MSHSESSSLTELVEKLDENLTRLERVLTDYFKQLLAKRDLERFITELADLLRYCKSDVARSVILELALKCSTDELKVAVLGPEGTFTHDVAVRFFSERSILLLSSVRDVVKAVSNNTAVFGVVPLENSLEGIVHETLDALEETSNVFINMCVERRVGFCIAASRDVESLSEIETLYVNPYAYMQCRENVSKLLSSVRRVVYVQSTAESAKIVSESCKAACLVSRSCAERYGLKVLIDHVEDRESYTKFALISRVFLRAGDRTSIIFTIPHRPGSLYRVLEVFARRSINLTMIYSRPTRRKPWHYYFYLEFEGSLTDELLVELNSVCSTLRLLGSYIIASL